MPIIELTTNVKVSDAKAFTTALSQKSAEILGMTKYITVTYKHDESMIFGGTYDPAFTMNVLTVLGIPTEKNASFSQCFFEFFEKELGIPNDRGYIVFNDPGSDRLGYKGTTFNIILASLPSRD
ncbi:Tautomerase/MIF [Guyanagaster necrorhizus]|uniref:L-dopachrome isomerase n=1 Tax=Guyanagaster necrorhizus TaxID=856835 RepID=A0A9P7VJ70_9AGAR|nr:Tautomerase/MIF [Guyanagaster necrorhizus MCA 3950]KAG7441477.1 Tautomerase/MIF [Guyanagaster necrorhizus MCA 3950]